MYRGPKTYSPPGGGTGVRPDVLPGRDKYGTNNNNTSVCEMEVATGQLIQPLFYRLLLRWASGIGGGKITLHSTALFSKPLL